MSDFQVIQSAVTGAARRRRWERAWRGAWTGLLAGSAMWLLALGVFKLAPLPWSWLAWAGLASALVPLAGFLAGGWRNPPLAETARWLDARRHLKERLSTALELSERETEWGHLVLRDAARHAQAVEPRELVPIRLPRATRWAALLLALAAGLGFVPEYRSRQHLQKQADLANIHETGRQLADLTRRTLQQRPPALEATRQAISAVAETGQTLERSTLTRSEALRTLAGAMEKLSRQTEELAKTPGVKPLERAAREGDGGSGKTPEALQRQIDSLRKSLGNEKATPDALDKLQNNLSQAQRAAAALPDGDSAAARAAREQLSQNLAALAQEARDLGQPLESLNAAMAALQKNQISQVLKDLGASDTDLAKLKEMAKTLSQLQQQANKPGRDLGEQLQNGQADAARQTLEKMVEQVRSAGLTSERLDKLLAEVAKAIDPAGEYGKVADHLKDAVQRMREARQSGSQTAKAQAGECLASAASELAKLGQQMGDMQALAAALDGMSRAEQAIATGQGWSQSDRPGDPCPSCHGKGCALCRGKGWGYGGGRKPGGVGTWADEEEGLSYYPDKIAQTPVDNSEVKRPDLASRGTSDRGPGETSDALKPTKVKGKMAPGGPMPSITLKGVSLKGQSTVKFEEAAAAAQSEAQSALNQDQVPRVYQNAVKDYFDDFKK